MSELPQTDPDLHAIFGIDGEEGRGIDQGGERVISVERAAGPRVELEERSDVGADVELERIADAEEAGPVRRQYRVGER